MNLKRELSYFDLTNIVIGSIVGSDIYIASAITAGLIGPFSIIVWLAAGIIAILMALVFAYSSYYVPKVGGSFAFVSKAFDDFYGFLAGWSMWIAEVLSLPVFAITFTNYLQYFIHLDFLQEVLVKGLFLFGLTFVNILGVKASGKLNDVLTLLKLSPLFLLIIVGLMYFVNEPNTFLSNYSPFTPLGIGNFGTALVLIFWAYAGFELGTLPASEVKDPKRTIPKAIITGILFVTLFYLATNFVVYGTINWTQLTKTSAPLILVGTALLGSLGAVIMSSGAMLSVSGSDESGILGTARLSYAMSIDGLFPKIFAKIHPKYGTPYMSLIIQGMIAFVVSIFSGITGLISFSVFNLAFSFLLTCFSLIILTKNKEKGLPGQNVIPWIGIVVCLYLIYSTSTLDKIMGSVLISLGIPIYIFFSPKADINHLKRLFISEESIFSRRLERKEKFLANFVIWINELYRKLRLLFGRP
ncbi:MAG: amino acid permease [Candidatus Aenigmarchaeota archaeon]|nr:amino acid permease [Candidatus Aenigmarchaeota archaeon]